MQVIRNRHCVGILVMLNLLCSSDAAAQDRITDFEQPYQKLLTRRESGEVGWQFFERLANDWNQFRTDYEPFPPQEYMSWLVEPSFLKDQKDPSAQAMKLKNYALECLQDLDAAGFPQRLDTLIYSREVFSSEFPRLDGEVFRRGGREDICYAAFGLSRYCVSQMYVNRNKADATYEAWLERGLGLGRIVSSHPDLDSRFTGGFAASMVLTQLRLDLDEGLLGESARRRCLDILKRQDGIGSWERAVEGTRLITRQNVSNTIKERSNPDDNRAAVMKAVDAYYNQLAQFPTFSLAEQLAVGRGSWSDPDGLPFNMLDYTAALSLAEASFFTDRLTTLQWNGLKIALAIDAFWTDTGAPPEELIELTLSYLPAVPDDMLGDESWQFYTTIKDDGRYTTVYLYGLDGDDDHGPEVDECLCAAQLPVVDGDLVFRVKSPR